MNAQPDPAETIEIRKYPNRRYYDTSRSRHLTLEDIRGMVRRGTNVRIVDSQTGADITSKTLMQMILEFDAPKVDLFTVPLLSAMIRVNDQVMKGFFEKFFLQALGSFFAFQNQIERQLREGSVLPSLFPVFQPWPGGSHDPDKTATEKSAPGPVPKTADGALASTVEELQRQMAALQEKLNRPRARRKTRKTR
jgi:polyhydroxyalkanoate synthesis repressor PhaR